MDTFDRFLDRIGEASGQQGLVEAVRNGYRVLTEGTDADGCEEFPDIPGWTLDDCERANDGVTIYATYIHGRFVVTATYDIERGKYLIHYLSEHCGKYFATNVYTYSGSIPTVIDNAIAERLRSAHSLDDFIGAMEMLAEYADTRSPLYIMKEYFNNEMCSTRTRYDTIGSQYSDELAVTEHYLDNTTFADILFPDYRADVTQCMFRHFLGDDYQSKPFSKILEIDPVELFMYGARESGYDLEYMMHLGIDLLGYEPTKKLDAVFNRMVEDVRQDPVLYAGDETSLFRDYARRLVNGDEI